MKIARVFLFAGLLTAAVSFGVLMLKKQTNSREIVVAFTGDVMLGRLVDETIERKGYDYPLGNIIPLLQATDLNIVNLETTLTKSTAAVPKVFNFKALPNRVKTLQAGRIDVVSLANNHTKDFGDEGLLETIETLDKAGIKHVGAGKNSAEARRAAIMERGGIKIGILGYTDNEPTWKAGPQTPGIHHITIGDIQTVKEDIAAVRDEVDILIATLHWGPNMQERPSRLFIDFAHSMVGAGVDIIHGHSAHIFQGVEIYKGKLIMYDTGDFVDDYHVTPELRNDLSFIFLVTVDKTGPKKLELISTLISNMQVNKAETEDKLWAMQRMQKLSAEFDTKIDENGILVISKEKEN